MPSSVPLSISVTCLPIEHLLPQLLSVSDYQYIVSLNSRSASLDRKVWVRACGWEFGTPAPSGARRGPIAAQRHRAANRTLDDGEAGPSPEVRSKDLEA